MEKVVSTAAITTASARRPQWKRYDGFWIKKNPFILHDQSLECPEYLFFFKKKKVLYFKVDLTDHSWKCVSQTWVQMLTDLWKDKGIGSAFWILMWDNYFCNKPLKQVGLASFWWKFQLFWFRFCKQHPESWAVFIKLYSMLPHTAGTHPKAEFFCHS